MATLGGTHRQTYTSPTPPDALRMHFKDPEAIRAATVEAESVTEVAPDTLRFVLQEQNQGGHRVKPDYTVEYRIEGDDLVWRTLEGNMTSEGRATFRAQGAGTALSYEHTIQVEMPIPRLAAKMLQPVVERIMRPSLAAYVDAMLASAPKG